MDSMVSARVPKEIRDQADRKLALLGSNHSKLINAAYEYLIEFGELPDAAQRRHPQSKPLTDKERSGFLHYLEATTLEIPAALAELSVKEIKAARLEEHHGYLA